MQIGEDLMALISATLSQLATLACPCHRVGGVLWLRAAMERENPLHRVAAVVAMVARVDLVLAATMLAGLARHMTPRSNPRRGEAAAAQVVGRVAVDEVGGQSG